MVRKRRFLLKSAAGFTDADIDVVRRGYSEWQRWVTSFLERWSESSLHDLPRPTYLFGDLTISPDRTLIVIAVSGELETSGVSMTFEDGVPFLIYDSLEKSVRAGLSLKRETEPPEAGLNQWYPATPVSPWSE